MTRLDQRLVELGLAPSRARAQALIAAGAVTVNGATVAKPGVKPAPDADIHLT
ncbi:MAG: S4 domain-containing protein, partial [Pseudomonadota bacterium]